LHPQSCFVVNMRDGSSRATMTPPSFATSSGGSETRMV
jgi:hypothetical protein